MWMFSAVWCIDFEFQAPPGETPLVHCMVAREVLTGQVLRLWFEDPAHPPPCPFPTGPETCFVAYFASAEIGCFLSLNWPVPRRLLDLYTEFRCQTNGLQPPHGDGLIGALAWFGLPVLDQGVKDVNRELAIRGGPFEPHEREQLLDYCERDVDALVALLPKLLPQIDWFRALCHGRYMRTVARMERTGIPIDVEVFSRLRQRWEDLRHGIVSRFNRDFGLYDGTTFKVDRWERYLAQHRIAWPRHPSVSLKLDDDTFRTFSRRYPQQVGPVRQMRQTFGKLRLQDLPVGSDGRGRCLLSPFRSKTGRNQPSTSRFVFGLPAWLRGLIKPAEGAAVAYIDWSQQEFAIAAALSRDVLMKEAYQSGDPYLEFAKQAGAVPSGATKESHAHERALFKGCALGVQYGMSAQALAEALGEPPVVGHQLLDLHRQTYATFWKWSQAAVDHGMLTGRLHTVFGWPLHVWGIVNPRSLANFPCQANGAEMLRLACCLISEAGLKLCAPVHDAIVVEASCDQIDSAVAQAQDLMCEAGRIVLDGFELRSEAEIIRYPNRFSDPRGQAFWEMIVHELEVLEETSGG